MSDWYGVVFGAWFCFLCLVLVLGIVVLIRDSIRSRRPLPPPVADERNTVVAFKRQSR